ncbi:MULTISPECIES: dipeptidase [Dehalobacter]|jgi:membrane dipeptidase|uniref:Membrane dipeptidase n=2 Tax=Dehalobacter restrictus TaxID=55583 RepID=A0A857DHA7_9FIRM|nr:MULTISPECIES: dipeptidase [Dehalobacter]AHF09682.1 peptidase [Dehalobacter restrictus DSM 9455]MCG1025616.1 dipeptidase [Dehalobacter sp.]MDJ0306544.1 dipeptidase [Dehalobacter sp.]OCZ51573.1 peptidase [Dehalobacter sp. TeCB1]QHA00277.1 membrane dipeptidase [Dehalobacter restrictus]
MKNIWIADGHCDSIGDYAAGKRNLKETAKFGHWDLTRAKQANLGLQFLAAYIESEYKPFQAAWRGLELLEAALRFIDHNSSEVFLVRTQEDAAQLGRTNKLGLLINIEGGEILGENIFMLDLIFRLGVRSIGLTWNERNAIGNGVGESEGSGGLSSFGFQVIERMNQLGMVIDVSHLNEAGFWDVLRHSERPVIASHSCAKALCGHRRNLTDHQLRALGDKKGLVGVNFCEDFLSDTGKATIDDVVRHICHIAEVAGVDAVGFGSDFDGIETTPEGLENVGTFPYLVEKLSQCGFNQNEIARICYGNYVRFLSDVLM